ncbi:hypothetical protein INR49_026748, partial [Caranx melampygus]
MSIPLKEQVEKSWTENCVCTEVSLRSEVFGVWRGGRSECFLLTELHMESEIFPC